MRWIATGRAGYLVSAPPEGGGGTLPRDFIRFPRCPFWRSAVRSGFNRMFSRGRGEAAINANVFHLGVTSARSFSLKSATTLLKWFVMVIEVPIAPYNIQIMSTKVSLLENSAFEGS